MVNENVRKQSNSFKKKKNGKLKRGKHAIKIILLIQESRRSFNSDE